MPSIWRRGWIYRRVVQTMMHRRFLDSTTTLNVNDCGWEMDLQKTNPHECISRTWTLISGFGAIMWIRYLLFLSSGSLYNGAAWPILWTAHAVTRQRNEPTVAYCLFSSRTVVVNLHIYISVILVTILPWLFLIHDDCRQWRTSSFKRGRSIPLIYLIW